MSARTGDLTEKWYEYVYRDRSESVRRFVENYPAERALSASCERFGHDYQFVQPLLASPDEVLRAGKAALARFLTDDSDRELQDVYLRVTDLPEESEVDLADLGAAHLNRLHTTRGRVVDLGTVRPKVVRAAFRCAKCEAVTRRVPQPGREFRTNAKCPRCNSVGYLSFAPDDSEYVDAQEVALRAPTESEEVPALLEHDLVGTASKGEDLQLVAIPRASSVGDSTITDLWLETVSVEHVTVRS